MYYMDFSKLRAEKSDFHDRIHNFYYSSDWAFPKKFIPRKLPAFDISNEEASQVFYYTTHSAGNNYYSTPSYWGAATAISTQIEIFNWHFNNIVNGLSPSLFVEILYKLYFLWLISSAIAFDGIEVAVELYALMYRFICFSTSE